MLFCHGALLATLKEAAPLHKRREQAAVVPAHSASIFADMHKSPLCLLAMWSGFRSEEAEQK